MCSHSRRDATLSNVRVFVALEFKEVGLYQL